MVIQAREKNEKVIPSLKELPLLGSVITHYGAGRFDLYRRIARECGDIGLFHICRDHGTRSRDGPAARARRRGA